MRPRNRACGHTLLIASAQVSDQGCSARPLIFEHGYDIDSSGDPSPARLGADTVTVGPETEDEVALHLRCFCTREDDLVKMEISGARRGDGSTSG
jgi:hypothetical protein